MRSLSGSSYLRIGPLSFPLAAVIAAGGLAVDGGAAAARPAPRHCATVHVTVSLHPTAHSQFGAFSLTETGSSCATAKVKETPPASFSDAAIRP